MFVSRFFRPLTLLKPTFRYFRLARTNPYIEADVKLTNQEVERQQTMPVWERVFDHRKYMEHEGPLKISTGLAFLDVEPFPRLKLMKLYYMILQEYRDVPDSEGYKQIIEELTKHRMEIVDTNLNIREIEEKISHGIIEDLIVSAHNELKLVQILKQWRPWEQEDDADDADLREDVLNVNAGNPFASVNENFQYDRHDRPERPKTANVNTE